MIGRILISLCGLVLTLASISAIYVTYLLPGIWKSNLNYDYVLSAVIGLAAFGPPLLLGLHSLIFRWTTKPAFDRIIFALMGVCGAVLIVFVAYDAWTNPTTELWSLYVGTFLAFVLSFGVCAFFVQLGRAR